MKEVSFVPKDFIEDDKTIPCPFGGQVLVKVPMHLERMKLIQELSYKTNAAGEVETNNENAIESTKKALAIVEKYVSIVDLFVKETNEPIKTIEELGYYEDGVKVMMQISGLVMGGIKLSKN